MATLKPLYVAKSLEELNKRISSEKDKQGTVKVLCRIADKMLLKAKDQELEGDQEVAYVLYMRFMGLYQTMSSSKKDNTEMLHRLIPSSKVKSALGKAEELSKSLKERYFKLQEDSGNSEKSQLSKQESDNAGPTSGVVANVKSSIDSTIHTSPSESSQTRQSSPSGSLSSISATQLYQLLTQQPDSVLVLDCRQRSEFNSSHPDLKKFPQWLCIPQELVEAGISDKSVLSFLPNRRAKETWSGRGSMQHIVLVDDSSTLSTVSTSKNDTLLVLRDALYKFDSKTPLLSDPRVLEGGYSKWHLTYAVTCMGKYTRKKQVVSSVQVQESELTNGMDYPEFPELEDAVDELAESDHSHTSINMDPEPHGNTVNLPDQDQLSEHTYSSSSGPPAVPAPSFLPDSYQPQLRPLHAEGFVGAAMMPPPVVSSAPLAPLNLEAETGLMAPTLLSDHDILTDYPQLRRKDEDEEQEERGTEGYGIVSAPAEMIPFTKHHQFQDSGASEWHGNQGSRVPPETNAIQMQQQQLQQQQLQQQQLQQAPLRPSQSQLYISESQYPHSGPPGPQHPNSGPPGPQHPHSGPPGPQHPHSGPPGPQHPNSGPPGPQHPHSGPPGPQPPNSGPQHPHSGPPGPQHPNSGPPGPQHPNSGPPGPHHPNSGPPGPQHPNSGPPGHHHPNSGPQHFNTGPSGPQHPHSGPPGPQHPNSGPPGPHHPNSGPPGPQHPNSGPPGPQPPHSGPPGPQHPHSGPPGPQHPHSGPPGPQHPHSGPPYSQPPLQTHQYSESQISHQLPHSQSNQIHSQPPPSHSYPPQPPSAPAPSQATAHSYCPPQPLQQQQQQQQHSSQVNFIQPSVQSSHPPQPAPPPSHPPQPAPPPSQVPSSANEEKVVLKELRQTIESELQLLREQREAGARQLAEDKAELEAQKREHQLKVEKDAKEYEEMRKKLSEGLEFMSVEKQRYMLEQQARQQQQQQVKQQGGQTSNQPPTVMRSGTRSMALSGDMPKGWEKRLNRQTGRYYYVDHTTQTTHWNPPTQLINYQVKEQRMQEAAAATKHTPQQQQQQQQQLQFYHQQQEEAYRKQQHRTQQQQLNRQQLGPGKQNQEPKSSPVEGGSSDVSTVPTPGEGTTQTPPNIDRRSKPPNQPSVDRSKKPAPQRPVLWTNQEMALKQEKLQPDFNRQEEPLRTGLRNLGNTCYMSATLQCLCHTASVMVYFYSWKFVQDINYDNRLGHKGKVAKEFAWLTHNLWSGRFRSVSPRDFKTMVDTCIPAMSGNSQQDAQEFLGLLMNELHEDLNRVKEIMYIPEQEGRGSDSEQAQLAWENHIKRNNSIIVNKFQGLYRSVVVCCSCKKKSTTFEPFMYLSLPIPAGDSRYTLQDCFRLFSKQEKVPWSCTSCKHSAGAIKVMEVWRLPAVLLIGLSRFSLAGWKDKRQNYIDYPTGSSMLNLSEFVVGDKPAKNYSLYAVANHFGTLTHGHYTACCRNPYDQHFYNYDDHEVKRASANHIKSVAAYLLFYTVLPHRPPDVR